MTDVRRFLQIEECSYRKLTHTVYTVQGFI